MNASLPTEQRDTYPAVPHIAPCPFCVRTAQVRLAGAFFRVECMRVRCGAEGPMRASERNAIKAWNRWVGNGY